MAERESAVRICYPIEIKPLPGTTARPVLRLVLQAAGACRAYCHFSFGVKSASNFAIVRATGLNSVTG